MAYAAMGIGSVLIGILLIPTGILAGAIYIIWVAMDRMLCWRDKE